MTLLEAWDQGTPVVGTNRGGIRDFMNEAGLSQCLFQPDDVDDAACAVSRSLEWTDVSPVVRIPGMSSCAERIVEIYRRACDSAPLRLTARCG